MKKRILSFLMALLMVVSIFPAPAYATDSTDVTITSTEIPAEEATEIATVTACPTCGTVGCTSAHLTWCGICRVDNCGKTHTACPICNTVDCTTNHDPDPEPHTHDYTGGACACGEVCPHTAYENGKCTTCGADEPHTHDFTGGACACGEVCAHAEYADGKCKVCGMEEPHTHIYTDGKCACGKVCDHAEYADGKCKVCGADETADDEDTSPFHANIGRKAQFDLTYTNFPIVDDPTGITNVFDASITVSRDVIPAELIVKIVDCYVNKTAGIYWYKVEAAEGHTLPAEFPSPAWVFQNYVSYSSGASLLLLDEEPENPCACCETCTGEEGCTCECGSCQFCEKEPEDELVDGPIYGTINGQTITVSGTLPQDVTVNVAPADVSQQLAQFDIPAEKLVFGLDISLRKDGADYQPGFGTKVKVPVTAAPGTKIGILHTHNGNTTYLCLTEVLSDGTVEFNTNGFSQFAGFTVDFHYNGIDYSIPGLTSITLSELFGILEINRDVAHVLDVKFSDTTLVSVTKIDGDWQLESLQAFDTEETLEITFYDGEIITIKVTDAAYPDRGKFTNHNTNNDAQFYHDGGYTRQGYRNFSSIAGISSTWSVFDGGAHLVYVYLYDVAGNPVDYSYFDEHPTGGGYLGFSGDYWFRVTGYDFVTGGPSRIDKDTLSMGTCGWPGSTINWVEVRMYSLDVWDNKSYCDVNQVSKFARSESGETGNRTVVIYAENNEVGRTSVYMPTFESISTSDLTVSPYAGWTHEKTTVSGSTYSVYLKRVSYTISYTLNGGQVDTSNPTTYNVETDTFTLNNPTKNGYTFTGWTGTDLSSASTTVTISKGSTGNRSYTANWTEKPYTITYDHAYTDEEGKQVISAQDYTITSTSGLLDPTRPGYEFLGWKLETAVGNWTAGTYSAGTPVTEKYGDVTLVAQWEDSGKTVTYLYDNTAPANAPALPEETTVHPGETVTVATVTTVTGYTFNGWVSENVEIENGEFTMPDEAVVLTGSWTPIEYKITYDYDNGDSTTPSKMEEETYTIKDAVKLMAAPAKADVPTDFRFTGWKLAQSVTAPNGNWTAGTFQAEQQFQEGQYGNITLVAQWERAAKDLTIRANSTDSDVNFVYTISGQGITITVAVPANNSVTIKSMPVGSYTITEKTAWSWRHTENYGNHSVTITKTEEEQSVVFEYYGNNNILWLNGYSYGKKGG